MTHKRNRLHLPPLHSASEYERMIQMMRNELNQLRSHRTTVYCTTRFNAIHHWPDAPEECGWLAFPHHHEFVVKAEVAVTDHDREVEFILLAREIDEMLAEKVGADTMTWSCERYARWIAERLIESGLTVVEVEVSEEGLHGARYRPAE